jgi:PEP-CTERM motif
MTVMKRSLVFAACAAMVLAVGRPSSAATITSTADDFNISWSFLGCGGTCTGSASFDVTAFDATTLVLDVDVSNTTVAAGEFLEALGWNMDPEATSASLTTSGAFLDNVSLNQVFPSFNTLNICVQGNPPPGSCGSGQPNGIPSPGSDSFLLSLTGDFSGGSVTLDTFALKYSGELGSFEGPGEETGGGTGPAGVGPAGVGPGGEIPEPTSMLLLGSGLAAAALRLRRNRK